MGLAYKVNDRLFELEERNLNMSKRLLEIEYGCANMRKRITELEQKDKKRNEMLEALSTEQHTVQSTLAKMEDLVSKQLTHITNIAER